MVTQNKNISGATIRFASVVSIETHINEFGSGSIDISLRQYCRHDQWLKLCDILFNEPTNGQLVADQTVSNQNPYIKEEQDCYDISSQTSRKQAAYIALLIREMLNEKLKGKIPSDDEIDEIFKKRYEASYPITSKSNLDNNQTFL